jgi:hypothetical protein
MSRLESIDRRVRFVHVAVALVLVVLSALALRLWALPRMTELASDKAYFASLNIPPLFDARKQGYSFDDAKRHLEALGPAARDYYAGLYILGYDLVFPVTLFAFGILFCLWMTQPTRRFAAALQPASRLAILIIPLGLFIFDILENISVLAMLKSYPSVDPGLASAASLFSRIKWLSAYFAWALAAALLVLASFRVLTSRRTNP